MLHLYLNRYYELYANSYLGKYFNAYYTAEWMDSDIVRTMINEIDNATLVNKDTVACNQYGDSYGVHKLSGGTRTLITMLNNPDIPPMGGRERYHYSSAAFGGNCIPHFLTIIKKLGDEGIDIHMNVNNVIQLPIEEYGLTVKLPEFDMECSNDKELQELILDKLCNRHLQ